MASLKSRRALPGCLGTLNRWARCANSEQLAACHFSHIPCCSATLILVYALRSGHGDRNVSQAEQCAHEAVQAQCIAHSARPVLQFDIHHPYTTVREALQFSAHLRFGTDTPTDTVEQFIAEVMALVELDPLSVSLVGRPGQSGLSVEQRKRLTIAVELVANPSIVFMDEPTSGARHAVLPPFSDPRTRRRRVWGRRRCVLRTSIPCSAGSRQSFCSQGWTLGQLPLS